MSYLIYIHHQICMRYMYNSKPVRDTSWEEGLHGNLQLQKFSSLTVADHNFHPVHYFSISSSSRFVSPCSTLDEFHLVTFFVFVQPGRIHRAGKRSQIATESTERSNAHKSPQNPPCGETLTKSGRIQRAKYAHKVRQNPPSREEKRSQLNPLCNQRSQIPTESKI